MKTAGALARLPQWSAQPHLNSGMIDASPLTMEQFGIAYGLDALCKPLEKLDALALRGSCVVIIYSNWGFYSVVQLLANKCLHIEKVL
jgi:hypothetical protein